MGDRMYTRRYVEKNITTILNKDNKITLPCLSLESALSGMNIYYFDFYSLDVEGAESKGNFTVIRWICGGLNILCWIVNNKNDVYEKYLKRLISLKRHFKEISCKYLQLFNDGNTNAGYVLDVVYTKLLANVQESRDNQSIEVNSMYYIVIDQKFSTLKCTDTRNYARFPNVSFV